MKRNLLLLFLSISISSIAQQTVSGTFSPPENYKWGILYEVTPIGTRYTTDTKIDATGNFTMPLDSTVTPGVYRFVYGVPPKAHNFEFIYNAEESIEFSFSEEKGLSFISSDENKRWTSYQEIMEVLQSQIDTEYSNETPNKSALDSLFQRQESIYYLYSNSSRGKRVASFINASQPYIPKNVTDKASYGEGKSQHFLQTIRYEDSVLQRSGFLVEQTLQFLEESTFSYQKNLDGIALRLMPCSQVFKKVFLWILWNRIQEAKKVDQANYLASAYLIPLASNMGDKELSHELEISVNTSVGAKAPNFFWKDMADNTRELHELNSAQNYVLVFWSSTCSHCLNELPKLQTEMIILPKGQYQVIAFGLEDDIYSWKNESLRLPEFLHVPGMGKWQNETGKAYGVSKTPTYFVLDADKVIKAKPDTLEELLEIIMAQ